MKARRRIAIYIMIEVQRLAALVAKRAAQAESMRKQRVSFRPLTKAEIEAYLGGELLAALSAPGA